MSASLVDDLSAGDLSSGHGRNVIAASQSRPVKGRLPCHLLILPRRTNRHRTVVHFGSSSWNRLNDFHGFGTVQSLNPEQITDSILKKSDGRTTRDAIETKTIEQEGQISRISIYADAPDPLED